MNRWLRSIALPALLGLALTTSGCPDDEVVPDQLYIEVSSDAPLDGGAIETLRALLVAKASDGTTILHPETATDPLFNLNLAGAGLDPVATPVVIQVDYDAATFAATQGSATVQLIGLRGGEALVSWEGSATLDEATILKAHLSALPVGAACDADGDGFLDCAVEGCCPNGPSAFADCEPGNASANLWGEEAACEPCADTVDNDCSGGDQPCLDDDDDGIADCLEATEECGVGDPKVGPGLAELCDGVDNDCDGAVDEGFTFSDIDGSVLSKGDACGTGACAGGEVVCDASGSNLACSTASTAEVMDACGDQIDNDCDGTIDEGCALDDVDGDGQRPPEDCNDYDANYYFDESRSEPCCKPGVDAALCDLNCDGTTTPCEADDADGDGFTVAEGDCDDSDPGTNPAAAEKCDDGIDQDCLLGDLACAATTDADGDNWPADADCDDNDATRNPDAVEVCDGIDNDCDGVVDDGNPDGGAACGSAVGTCEEGVEVCVNSGALVGTIDCIAEVGPSDEVCDGLDNDCDGDLDEGFEWQGVAIGESCDGVGACGAGVVECLTVDSTTCSSNPDGSASDAQPEVCDTLDNDCDGEVNEDLTSVEDSTCDKQGACGADLQAIVATCDTAGVWQCDYSAVANFEGGAESSCDGIDNDCDGDTDDEFLIGSGCDGADADSCANGVLVCKTGDTSATECDESQATLQQEICDGLDNDCDEKSDEDFVSGADNTVALTGAAYAPDNGKFKGDACGTGACGQGQVSCDVNDRTQLVCVTPSDPADEGCDGADNDCDGSTDEGFDNRDGDADADCVDDDDDDDGKDDDDDDCPRGEIGWTSTAATDFDGDGCRDSANEDADDDNDGVSDTDDACQTADFDLSADADGDGCDDADEDTDDDNDGVSDADDDCVTADGDLSADFDGDGCDDADEDIDDDNDGVRDGADDCATADGDLSADFDGDGCDDADEDTDDDNDGVDDGSDDCVTADLSLSADFDGDGCDDADEDTDDDNDGVDDGDDDCLTADGDLSADFDGDGCDDADEDTDDDNDGVDDGDDDCLTADGDLSADFDGDGCDDADEDTDDDNDGKADADGDMCLTADGDLSADVDDDGCDDADEDTCLDVDGDGWGRSGFTRTGCPEGEDVDCNDDADNSDDDDGDNICIRNGTDCSGGDTTNCSDNCPSDANADQADADDDAVGDVCDTCVDADDDGWGREGFVQSSCANQGDDCNDGAGNGDDADGDNVCINKGDSCSGGDATECSDNCPATSNADQADLDDDGVGDVCDTCTDVDGDDWGRTGFTRSGCVNGEDEDCNDEADNTEDSDGDNICINNGAACTGGDTTECSDNCPVDANATQADEDGDSIGDACDTCTDEDADGYGRTGFTNSGCPNDAFDCNDAADNSDDEDGDNVCINNGDDCSGGATTECSDNCPSLSNANQADADEDAVGDACDTCVDADGDDWGREGFPQTGCGNTGDDCNDASGNSDDGDGDNICINNGDDCSGGDTTECSDNCPSDANADQADTDEDAVGDACDTCTDVDGDGWGRAGFTRTGCAEGEDEDCDDTAGNTSDADGDNFCSDIDCNDDAGNSDDVDVDNVCINNGDPCTGGATTGCSDNCPSDANPDQANFDNTADGGDACDDDDDNDGKDDADGDMCLTADGNLSADNDDDGCDDADEDLDDDNDTVLDDGDASGTAGDKPCTSDSANAPCDDNCQLIANPDQGDVDSDGVGDACTTGNLCADPIVLTLDTPVLGNTTSADSGTTDDYTQAMCTDLGSSDANAADGPDQVYSFTAAATGVYEISVDANGEGTSNPDDNLIVYAFDDPACAGSDCLGWINEAGNGGEEILRLTVESGETIYPVVDSADGDSDDYLIEVSVGCHTDLIISEYVEGPSDNKAIEIYNGTGATVDLENDYMLVGTVNTGPWGGRSYEFDAGTTLAHGEVYVVCSGGFDDTYDGECDVQTTDTQLDFNGNDGVALAAWNATPADATRIDAVGFEGISSDLNCAGVTGAGADHSWVRKATVSSPTTDWSASAGTDATDSQWIVTPNDETPGDTFPNLGSHDGGLSCQ